MKYIFDLKDDKNAVSKPNRWVLTKGVLGRRKVIGQLAKVKKSNLTLPASFFMKSKRKVMCKNLCVYNLDFNMHNVKGSITLGVKAESFIHYIGITFVFKSLKEQ